MRREPVYDYALLVLSVILLAVIWTPGCAFETDPLNPSRRDEVAGSVAVTIQATTFKGSYKVINSTRRNGVTGEVTTDMAGVDRMNACLRMVVRTFDASGYPWACSFDEGPALCRNSHDSRSPVFLTGCEPTIGSAHPETCKVNSGYFNLGSCTWSGPDGGQYWVSTATLSGGKVLLGGEAGYTNKWSNP